MTRSTNTEFVTELMEFSKHGAMMQVFLLEAVSSYATYVVQNPEMIPEDGMIARDLWVGCAQELLDKLKERFDE